MVSTFFNNNKKKSDFDCKLNPVICYEIRWFELKLKRISITFERAVGAMEVWKS